MKILNKLLLIAAFTLPLAHAASFDCAKASTRVEKAICSEKELSDFDDQLLQSYKKATANVQDAVSLKSDQKSWLTNVRNKCQDSACLKRAYATRIAALSSTIGKTTANVAGGANQATGATGGLPIIVIKAVPQTIPDKGIKSRAPFEFVGKVEFGHDEAGGKYVVGTGKKEYTLGHVWELDDATQDKLIKISDSGTPVTVKGTLKVWKDGSAAFDNADPIKIFK